MLCWPEWWKVDLGQDRLNFEVKAGGRSEKDSPWRRLFKRVNSLTFCRAREANLWTVALLAAMICGAAKQALRKLPLWLPKWSYQVRILEEDPNRHQTRLSNIDLVLPRKRNKRKARILHLPALINRTRVQSEKLTEQKWLRPSSQTVSRGVLYEPFRWKEPVGSLYQ